MLDSPLAPQTPYDSSRTLSGSIADLFFTADVTMDNPEPGQVRLRGRLLIDLDGDTYDKIQERWNPLGYTLLIRRNKDQNGQPMLIAQPGIYEAAPLRWKLNLLLFVLTIGSTMLVGAGEAIVGPDGSLALWPGILAGWPFSLCMLLILGAHELGHYFASRYHGLDASLPFFIPFPTILGTMGAVIVQRQPTKDKRALLDIGAAGPLVGLVFAIPILFYGLATAEVGVMPESCNMCMEGNSLLYALAKTIVFGEFLPANGLDVQLNQVAMAGWAGLLVTAINLMPVGQLDGGHMAYVLFGKGAENFFWPTMIGLLVLSAAFGGNWYLWMGLLYLFGRKHPPLLDEVTPLDPRRKFIAILSLALFFVLFVPSILTSIP